MPPVWQMKAEAYDLSRDEWEYMIDQYIFSERDRALIKCSLLDAHTYAQIAERFDMSERQVARIIPKLTNVLARRIPRH